MKVFQCSSQDGSVSSMIAPSIPVVFPQCCPYPYGQCCMMPNCCPDGCIDCCSDPTAIFPLGELPCDSTSGVSPFPQNTLTQNTVAPAASATPPVNSAAASFAALPQSKAAPAMGSAVQYSLRSSEVQNAQLLSMVPDVISGQDIRSHETGLLFAPGNLYFVSLSLKAQAGSGEFCEVIAQIDGALHPDLCAFSTVPQSEEPQEEPNRLSAGLCTNFLLDTVGAPNDRLVELMFHTSADHPVAVTGNLLAFKLGSILQE